jgi:putative two-component system response regulator
MPERILVVDDDPRVRDILTRFLEREGYVTIPASSGEEALERVAAYPPDLVLLDVQLPGIDGFTVCHALKENEATALIPVTILSGLQDAEARTRGIESGADDFITNLRSTPCARIRTTADQAIDRPPEHEMVVFSMARWVEIRSLTEGICDGSPATAATALALGSRSSRRGGPPRVLHDIGKIGVRRASTSRPADGRGAPSAHAEYGAAIVAPMRFAGDVAPIIPLITSTGTAPATPRLRGNRSPRRASSPWSRLRRDDQHRPYRKSLGNESARRLRAGSGTQRDPSVVDVFLSPRPGIFVRSAAWHDGGGTSPSFPGISAPDRSAA